MSSSEYISIPPPTDLIPILERTQLTDKGYVVTKKDAKLLAQFFLRMLSQTNPNIAKSASSLFADYIEFHNIQDGGGKKTRPPKVYVGPKGGKYYIKGEKKIYM